MQYKSNSLRQWDLCLIKRGKVSARATCLPPAPPGKPTENQPYKRLGAGGRVDVGQSQQRAPRYPAAAPSWQLLCGFNRPSRKRCVCHPLQGEVRTAEGEEYQFAVLGHGYNVSTTAASHQLRCSASAYPKLDCLHAAAAAAAALAPLPPNLKPGLVLQPSLVLQSFVGFPLSFGMSSTDPGFT